LLGFTSLHLLVFVPRSLSSYFFFSTVPSQSLSTPRQQSRFFQNIMFHESYNKNSFKSHLKKVTPLSLLLAFLLLYFCITDNCVLFLPHQPAQDGKVEDCKAEIWIRNYFSLLNLHTQTKL